MTHGFKGFSSFLLTNWQWYHQSCLPPHRRTHSAKVCSVIVYGCERRASGHFWILLKAQVVLRSNSKPTFLRTASQFPRRNYTPPSVSPRALYHPYQGLETHGSYVSHLWSPGGQHCPVQFCTRRAWIDETSSTVNLLWTACLKAGHVWLGVWALLRNCKDLSTVPVGKHRSMSE